MRISDWSSDVCSSDLPLAHRRERSHSPGEDGGCYGQSNPGGESTLPDGEDRSPIICESVAMLEYVGDPCCNEAAYDRQTGGWDRVFTLLREHAIHREQESDQQRYRQQAIGGQRDRKSKRLNSSH